MTEVEEYIKFLATKIVEKINPEKIILFGSYANGTSNLNSDIDILVILKDSTLPRHKRTGNLYVEMKDYYTNYSLDFVVYTEAEVNKWANVSLAFITSTIKKGKILYERKS